MFQIKISQWGISKLSLNKPSQGHKWSVLALGYHLEYNYNTHQKSEMTCCF